MVIFHAYFIVCRGSVNAVINDSQHVRRHVAAQCRNVDCVCVCMRLCVVLLRIKNAYITRSNWPGHKHVGLRALQTGRVNLVSTRLVIVAWLAGENDTDIERRLAMD